MTEFYHDDLTVGIGAGVEGAPFPDGSFRFDVEQGDDVACANVSQEFLHALADWIIANVPKPEPTPLPTKFAAVVKSRAALYTLADDEKEPKWIEAGTNGVTWANSDFLRDQGFEVIFDGVEDDTEAAADAGVDD